MKEIRQYCVPSKFLGIVAFPVFSVLAVIILNSEEYSDIGRIQKGFMTCLFIIFAIVLSYLCFYLSYGQYASRFKTRMLDYQEKGMLPIVEDDFRQGVRLFDGNLIVGKEFMFGRKTGFVLMYNEMI